MALITYANGETRNADIVLDEPYELNVAVGAATQAGDIFDDGVSYGIEKTGGGVLTLTGDNDYDGPTLIRAGGLILDSGATIDTASDFTLAIGTTLGFGADVTEAFLGSIAGYGDIDLGDGVALELDDLSAAHVFAGRIFDDGSSNGSFAICACGGGSLTVTGSIDIGGILDIDWGGQLTLDGGTFAIGDGVLVNGLLNVIDGATLTTTMLNGTKIVVDGDGSSITASTNTFVTGVLVVSDGGQLTSLGGADIASCSCEEDLSTADVTGAGSRWDITGSLLLEVPVFGGIVTVDDGGTLTASTSIVLGPDSILYIGTGGIGGTVSTPSIVNDGQILADFTDARTLDANITGEGFLQKDGSGTLTLTGSSTYSGVTYLNGGRLNVNGAITSDIAVVAGTTLGGKGSVGVVIAYAGATVAPGNSAGALSTEDFTLLAGARLEIEIAGATAGSGYDQVRVQGVVNVAGATLDLSLLDLFEPRFGQSYTIVDNDGADAVVGAFAGYADGAVFMLDGRLMTITYQGGDGNDIVVSKTPPPTTIVGTEKADLIDATHTVAGQLLPTSDADEITGLGGGDTIAALGGDDEVRSGNGRDTVHGGDGSDWISGGKGKDTLSGEAGSDTLKGGKGGDVLRGGDGDDVLVGGPGQNILAGGAGSDTFVFRSAKASDRIRDFGEGDIIALSKSTFAGLGPKGTLKAKAFHVGSEAETKSQHILYDKKSGWLLYAKKGVATANPQEIVKIGKHLDGFDHHDILVI